MKIKQGEIYAIAAKMRTGTQTQDETNSFLQYVAVLEGLVELASNEDFYGTQGWEYVVWGE